MRKLLFVLVLVLCGCADTHENALQISQGDRTWLSCNVTLGSGWAKFVDKETGKTIVVYGNALLEQTDIPCQTK